MSAAEPSSEARGAIVLGATALGLAVIASAGVVGALVASDDFSRQDAILAVALFGGVCAGLASLGAWIAAVIAARRVTGAARSRALLLPILTFATWVVGGVLAAAWIVWLTVSMPIALQ
ncbi:MAG: hypothetical protein U0234_05755 [Sandaracinus sp.]